MRRWIPRISAAAAGSATLAGSQQTNNTNTVTVTLSSGISAGHGVWIVAMGASSGTTMTVADTGLNTYTQRTSIQDTSNGISLITATAPVSIGLSVGNAVVVTGLPNNTDWYVFVYDISSFTGYDQHSSKFNGFGTSHTSDPTPSISGSNDIALAAFACFGQAWTSTWSGDSALSPGTAAMGSRNIMLRSKNVTSGAQTATANTGAGVVSAALIDCLQF